MNEHNKSMEHFSNIRNFVVIAHIDHGKSTLADRMLELTNTIEARKMKPQYLDQLELERERGITIKMAPVRMQWHPQMQNAKIKNQNDNLKLKNGKEIFNFDFYTFNLIDTPGHSDFSYEVSRALAAVEGAILLVDATKGIQAQTLSNFRMARNAGLTIIGAVNKIDLRPPGIEKTQELLADLLGVPKEEILRVSGKTGEGVQELLKMVVRLMPPPATFSKDRGSFSSRTISGNEAEMGERAEKLSGRPLDVDEVMQGGNFSQGASRISRDGAGSEEKLPRALIFDSLYDDHKGIIAFVRVFDGEFAVGDDIRLVAADKVSDIKEVGYFAPELKPGPKLSAGEIGYIATGIKEPALVKIGDTVIRYQMADTRYLTSDIRHLVLSGYKELAPVVFVSFYPDGKTKFEDLKRAFERLRLTDSSLSFEPDSSEALGRGLKAGFLGQLHFEIAASRLEREFGLHFLTSFPSIAYRVKNGGKSSVIKDPYEFPDSPESVFQPMIAVEIFTPPAHVNQIMTLKEIFYLEIEEIRNIGENVVIAGKMPLAELMRDFDGKLKSASAGFASFSYELAGEAPADVEKLEILVNGEPVPALTRIVFKAEAQKEGRATVGRLKELLPAQQFSQALQARVAGRIIARETIPSLRKDVTGYLYGGDRTRKMKLWKKQKAGKKRLKETGRVNLAPEVFRELLKK